MGIEVPARLFRHADGQAVAIPHGLELPGEQVMVRQEEGRLILVPSLTARKSLAELLASWEPLDEVLGPIEDTPPRPVEL